MNNRNEIHDALVAWYKVVKRDLPWRKTQDPYKIWISEVMLQQTLVETVKGYYTRFLETFPTVYDLAGADDELLMKHWEGGSGIIQEQEILNVLQLCWLKNLMVKCLTT